MGVVFLARDTRLDRDVAIKVLPDVMTSDKERVLRFEREAKLLASLNHPNIAQIHGFEDSDGRQFLVLEYVEGQTLADRLKHGPLPMDEALGIGKQIAEALEAAHDKEIIHRDLKPGNVMITPAGTVKVLDFGLAKAMADDPSSVNDANSPTITANFTRPGVVLGTAAYMSPEQARGKPLDKRTDIWSFGVLLYESLGGRRPFDGETTSDLIARILERQPDWTAIPPQTPPLVQLLLRRCLTKDASKRLRDMGDARIELANAIADPTSSSLGIATAALGDADRKRAPSAWQRIVPWLVALGAVVALIMSIVTTREGASDNRPQVARLTIPVTGMVPRIGQLAIDPNGQYIVYRTEAAGQDSRLRIRRLNEFTERVLGGGLRGGYGPFVSPDGNGIGFFSDGDLRVTSPSGNTSRRICEAFGNRTAAWGADGVIVFSTGRSGDNVLPGLSRVRSSGGTPEVLTTVDSSKRERAHLWPAFLPDGRHILFTIETDAEIRASIAVLSLETGEYETVLDNASQPHYAPTGHLIFNHQRSDKVFAVGFDAETRRVLGEPVEVNNLATPFAVLSQNGTLAYLPYGDEEGSIVLMVDRRGNETALVEHAGSWAEPRFSPDARKIILRKQQSPDCFLWLYDLDRSTLTRLSFEGDSHAPAWSADGRHVYAGVEGEVMRSIYRMPVDGSAPQELLWKGDGPELPGRGRADGSMIPFTEDNVRGDSDIWVLSLGDEPKAQPFLQTPFNEEAPALSPNGGWIAYASDESGSNEIYMRPYPGPGAKIQVSTDGGDGPLWSGDGKALFYSRGRAMITVEVTTDPNLRVGAPSKLFEVPYFLQDFTVNYDVAPDGQSFLMVKPRAHTGATRELHIVLNWFEELKAKVPTGAER
jgi:serine/threonine-protein kinase